MKTPTSFAFALLLTACHDEPLMTFGLDLRVLDGSQPAEQTSASCVDPGASSGATTGSSIVWGLDEAPPHLFMDAEPDAEDNVYRVRVYVSSERDEERLWWKPSEILAERVYDAEFGEGGARDAFGVDFEGQPYTVEVLGVPVTCPR